MAIFHLNEKNISRSDGRSAVACAAYRACEKLEDYTFGKTQDYTRKKGLEYKSIYAPEHTNEKLLDRQTLWNAVEKKEFNANGSMKENARLAKEYICALPHELTDQERIKIVDDFCRDFVKKHNVIVDACIHAPHDNNDETDNKNYHVHIMFTTRLVNEKGELGKKQRTFNDDGPKILKDSRATFANVVNTALENAGLDERVDHRSYEDQGLKFLEPTQHEGHEVTALRRDGIDTEISLKNDAIKAKNLAAAREYQQVIKGLNQEIIVPNKLEDQIAELENELRLTDAEEHELLAELANLDHEEKLLQEIVNNREYFIELQKVYSDFSNDFYSS
ncbi:MAG: MobQ family relaxase, partial [Sulfurimonas sp.]|nr:MobQ family relaxase [Sulfurimonas sp.]